MTELGSISATPKGIMSSISVVIPAYNASSYLRRCLEHLTKSTVEHECIVVDDGSTDDTRDVAAGFGATVLSSQGRMGPAFARNLGARASKGDVIFFIDADVCVHADTLARVRANFDDDPDLAAVIGSYDDSPHCQDFLSQYKNLMHCYVHQHGRREACTFWSGCGAIRKKIFLEHSGFDESYRRPAIEDIELGYRLTRAKNKMVLDPLLRVKHLKAWSFISLVKTDIFDRGIPWTELILRDKNLPNDLNLQLSQRVSVALVYILMITVVAGAISSGATFILPLLALLFLVLSSYEAESTWTNNPRAIAGTVVLVATIVGLAMATQQFWLAPPVLLAYLLLFLRHRYAYNERRRRMTGIFCGIYLLFVVLFVLTYLPRNPLVFAFFLLLSVVVALNSQFYVFLAGRTGRLLALAAIPFHLLFHFYNGVSFAIGLARHTVNKYVGGKAAEMKKERWSTPTNP
jgi:glycosyltransferase involved in cell wall biosynthesis